MHIAPNRSVKKLFGVAIKNITVRDIKIYILILMQYIFSSWYKCCIMNIAELQLSRTHESISFYIDFIQSYFKMEIYLLSFSLLQDASSAN